MIVDPQDVVTDLLEKLNKSIETNYPRVRDAYGQTYANGWRAGRTRDLEILKEESKNS